jgi:hypothetical protein
VYNNACTTAANHGAEVSNQTWFFNSAYPKSANSWAQSAVANPQISEGCQSANRKSANFHVNPQIPKFQQNTAQPCLKTVLKLSALKMIFFISTNLNKSIKKTVILFYAIGRKIMYLAFADLGKVPSP